MIQRTGAAYKEQSGALSAATLDRAENAITYRVFGREKKDRMHMKKICLRMKISRESKHLEHGNATGVSRHLHGRCAVHFVFRTENVLGTGWRAWGIAAFTTFCRAL